MSATEIKNKLATANDPGHIGRNRQRQLPYSYKYSEEEKLFPGQLALLYDESKNEIYARSGLPDPTKTGEGHPDPNYEVLLKDAYKLVPEDNTLDNANLRVRNTTYASDKGASGYDSTGKYLGITRDKLAANTITSEELGNIIANGNPTPANGITVSLDQTTSKEGGLNLKLSCTIVTDSLYATKIGKYGTTPAIGNAAKPVYVDSSGVVTALTGSRGTSGKKIIYMNSGEFTESTSTVGGTAKPVYLNNGTITECNGTAGSINKPVYMNNGTITACSGAAGSQDTANKTFIPIYMSSGEFRSASVTIGSADTPVYMDGGTIKSTGKYFNNYLKVKVDDINGDSAWTDDYGVLNIRGGQYVYDSSNTSDSVNVNRCGINMNNSDIVKLNSIYFADSSNTPDEGINFVRSNLSNTTTCDTLWVNSSGTFYFTAGRTNISGTGTNVLSVTNAGNVTAAGSFNVSSDIRLKRNIKSYNPNKSILDLPIYEFDYVNTNAHSIGCISQELKELFPELVDEDTEGFLSVKESKLVYLLLLEVKKLREGLINNGITL